MRRTPVACTLLLTSAALAQTPAAPPAPAPNGVVTGRVFCGDTGRPCRFASVTLRPASTAKTPVATASGGTATVIDTSIDGSFLLDHVAPGRYYVIVRKEGYIEPSGMFTTEQLNDPTPQVRDLVKQALTEVVVEQDSTASVNLQIQRGAAISGTVTYDDGTPASRVTVKLQRKNASGKWSTPSYVGYYVGARTTTDDRGHYRIISLLPDTYLVVSSLELYSSRNLSGNANEPFFMRSARSNLSFYGEGKVHIEDAKSIIIRGDEEHTGVDIIIPLNKLHKLTGRVAIEPGSHFANAASVDLLYGDQKTVIASDIVSRDDGLFHFEFVPEGAYTLRITNARDVTWDPPDPKANASSIFNVQRPDHERTLQSYGDAEMPVTIQGDMLDVIATVKPQQSKTAGASGIQ